VKRALLLVLLGACSSGPPGVCEPGEQRCESNQLLQCADDAQGFATLQDCSATDQQCWVGQGCLNCIPDGRDCGDDGLTIRRCRPDGSGWDTVGQCDPENNDVCNTGECVNACELSVESRSYEGCEYYAVDLDNAVVSDQGAAAAQQFSVVLSNPSPLVAQVSIDIWCTAEDAANPALQCAEGAPFTVDAFPIAPGGLKIVDLDPREVDGSSSPWLNDGPGTFRSLHAFRITSSAPLIAYQFNPLDNVGVFSNDASLLLPATSLDNHYLVLSWPQTLSTVEFPTLTDLRAFVTIVGLQPDTHVSVRLSTRILGGADIPAAQAGESVELTLGPFEVINLETDDFNADFTGTDVRSDFPVAVFTGSEASDVPRFDDFTQRLCCADHMEEQLFPESAMGTRFVAVRTPIRSAAVEAGGWNVSVVPDEPEWWRIIGTREDTSVITNLPPPNDSFFLARGQSVIFESERDFVLHSSQPIAFGQFPGGQETTGIDSTLEGGIRPPGGDPSYMLIPPVQQWRDDYLFLVPNKYAFDYLLIGAPTGVDILYDDLPLDDALSCDHQIIGTLTINDQDIEYNAIRCQLSFPTPDGPGVQDDGVHRLRSVGGEPIGLVVWGWDSYVSYGYPGGTNVALINVN
jgi:IgGFc binding protein